MEWGACQLSWPHHGFITHCGYIWNFVVFRVLPIVAFQICGMLNQNKRKGGEYVMKLVETFLPEQTCYLSSSPHIILFPLRQIFDHISVHMQIIERKKIVNAYLLYFNTLCESVTIGRKQIQNEFTLPSHESQNRGCFISWFHNQLGTSLWTFVKSDKQLF